MKNDITATARAVLDGSARNDDAKALALWVLERVEEETADTERPPPGRVVVSTPHEVWG